MRHTRTHTYTHIHTSEIQHRAIIYLTENVPSMDRLQSRFSCSTDIYTGFANTVCVYRNGGDENSVQQGNRVPMRGNDRTGERVRSTVQVNVGGNVEVEIFLFFSSTTNLTRPIYIPFSSLSFFLFTNLGGYKNEEEDK